MKRRITIQMVIETSLSPNQQMEKLRELLQTSFFSVNITDILNEPIK